ncbi:MAG TPA: FRG domain-containing protein [Candidatus Limnocylindria bacterium]|nr:FRG domain-containing protein [Candidatus Limnocylindria bacterium]
MAPFREIPIADWANFVEFIDKGLDAKELTPFIPSSYVFRGQAQSNWPLRHSLRRAGVGLPAVDLLRVEQLASDAFHHHVYQHLDAATIQQAAVDRVPWWILMQHHGAPTRLLDWTASAYVAAYFAVVREPDTAGAVWAVHARTTIEQVGNPPASREEVNQLFLDSDPGGQPPRLFVLRPTIETRRMAAQQTIVTVSPNVIADHGPILEGIPEPPGKALFLKFVIPAALKLEFLRKLRQLNITAQVLFPGVDGLGRSVSEVVYLDAQNRARLLGRAAGAVSPDDRERG